MIKGENVREIKKEKTAGIKYSLLMILFAFILTVPFIMFNNNQPTAAVETTRQEAEQTRYDMPGVYYATAGEVAETDMSSIFSKQKGGLFYIGKGSSHTMNGGRYSGYSAVCGGAVYIANGGTFTMNGGEIVNNRAVYGGAIYVANGGTCYLNGGRIANNAGTEAAAIYVEEGGILKIKGCVIEDNVGLEVTTINYYVDGEIAKRDYILNQETIRFNLAKAPLDYQHCNGYFTDEGMTQGIEDGEILGEGGIYNVYTCTATDLNKFEFIYNANEGGYYTVKQNTSNKPTGVVVIPRQYNNGTNGIKDVKAIYNATSGTSAGAFYDNNNITAVYMPNTLTSIGQYAFTYCTGLTSITIPNSVTSIGSDAFEYCTGLTSITIPNSVTSIGNSAFSGCRGLTSIVVDSGNTKYASRDNCNAIIEKSTNTLIQGCKNTTIPNSVTSIGYGAFDGCTGLTEITIPDSVTSIGNSAFAYCSGLTSITIPNSVTSIGNSAFHGCSGITSIVVDSGNTKYDSRDNCNAIIEKSTNTLIQGCNNTTIPNSVESIGEFAFHNCKGLTSVTIPNSVTSIGDDAFDGCSGLTGTLTIPDSVTSIGKRAFLSCSWLTSITIPNSVTSIGNYAFFGCSRLTSVTINTSGWYYTSYETATSGTEIDVTNASTNATNLKYNSSDGGLAAYYWKRNAS